MSNKYEDIDRLIIDSVIQKGSFLYDYEVNKEAKKIAQSEKRIAFRIIDLRAQNLRKEGKIFFQRGKDACWRASDEILNSRARRNRP